jgi:probable lipoprotein NlpC
MAPKSSASSDEKNRAFLNARHSVINASKKYINTPYLYGGVSSGGLDCSGLIYVTFSDALGVTTPRSSSGLYTWTERIHLDKAQPGDLLFFKTDNTGKITHVALYLGNRRFIHSASSGPNTGVIYSSLDERYWARTYAAAGRVFPETSGLRSGIAGSAPAERTTVAAAAPVERNVAAVNSDWNSAPASGWGGARLDPPGGELSAGDDSAISDRLSFGIAIAPTWVGFLKGGEFFRGFASQIFITVETYNFGPKMAFGFQVRPEYDGALGVFRLPFTFSWGPSEKIMIFAGPVLSFGDASISTDDGNRRYAGGTSWFGAAGIIAAPFTHETDAGDFSPYIEAAWQYYISDNESSNVNADFSAGFRFSTGVLWSMKAR